MPQYQGKRRPNGQLALAQKGAPAEATPHAKGHGEEERASPAASLTAGATH